MENLRWNSTTANSIKVLEYTVSIKLSWVEGRAWEKKAISKSIKNSFLQSSEKVLIVYKTINFHRCCTRKLENSRPILTCTWLCTALMWGREKNEHIFEVQENWNEVRWKVCDEKFSTQLWLLCCTFISHDGNMLWNISSHYMPAIWDERIGVYICFVSEHLRQNSLARWEHRGIVHESICEEMNSQQKIVYFFLSSAHICRHSRILIQNKRRRPNCDDEENKWRSYRAKKLRKSSYWKCHPWINRQQDLITI